MPGHGECRGRAECEDDVKHGGGGVVEASAEPVVVLSLAGLELQLMSDIRQLLHRLLSNKTIYSKAIHYLVKIDLICDKVFIYERRSSLFYKGHRDTLNSRDWRL